MGISYGDWKNLNDKIDSLARSTERIEAKVNERSVLEQDVVALRARVAELEGQIAGAVDATDAVEAGARAGLPAQS